MRIETRVSIGAAAAGADESARSCVALFARVECPEEFNVKTVRGSFCALRCKRRGDKGVQKDKRARGNRLLETTRKHNTTMCECVFSYAMATARRIRRQWRRRCGVVVFAYIRLNRWKSSPPLPSSTFLLTVLFFFAQKNKTRRGGFSV